MKDPQKNKLVSSLNKQISFDVDLESVLSGKKLYIFAFFVPVIMLFISYMIFRVYPSGYRSVLAFDLNAQYVSYYEDLMDSLRGNGSLLNSWSRNLSGEMFGIFAYYMASPFMLVVFLLPRSMITESILIMQLLKVGTASVTFCLYLRRSKKAAPYTSLIFSVLYSLMTYVIVQLMNPMWLDGLIYLPLICLGIEQLVDRGRLGGIIVPLALMFMANFYIGWMTAVFSCFYFLAYYLFISDSDRSLKLAAILRCGLKFAFCGILSALCSAWILIPVYFSLSLGKFGFSDPSYDIVSQFELADLFASLLPNTYDTINSEGSPLMYCGILTLLLIPLYFFNSAVDLRQKIGFGFLTAVLVFSMQVYAADVIWHGFQAPNWLPYRYSFILSFLLLVMAAQAFEKMGEISFAKIGCAFLMILGYVIYEEKLDAMMAAGSGGSGRIRLFATVWFTVCMSAAYALLLYFRKKNYKIKSVPVVISVCVIIELIFTTVYTMDRIDDEVSYADRDSYNRYVSFGRDTVNKIYGMDSGVYRIEKDFCRSVNDAMAFGSFGISHSSSMLNASSIQLFRRLGFSNIQHMVLYSGETYITDSVFGIKYLITQEERSSSEEEPKAARTKEDRFWDQLKITFGTIEAKDIAVSQHYDELVLVNGDDVGTVYVYENPYALPIGFMADAAVAGLHIDSDDPFENQNMLFSALISDEKQDFFTRIDIDETVLDNVRRSKFGEDDKYEIISGDSLADIEFRFTVPTDDIVYAYFPAEHEKAVALWLDNYFLDRYFATVGFENKNDIITLGSFESGTEHSIGVNFLNSDNEAYFKDVCIYSFDKEKFTAAVEELKRQPLEIVSFREDHIRGTVTAEKDGILFTSIAWEPGWTILVDGEETDPVELVDALIGIPITAGTHTVEMKFFPRGLALGITISVPGIAAAAIICILENKKRKENSSKE